MSDYGFKYEIGQRVRVVECEAEAGRLNATLKPDAYARYGSPLLVVRGRLLEECYGGVQRHYDCRVIQVPSRTVGDMNVAFSTVVQSNGMVRLFEPELMAAE